MSVRGRWALVALCALSCAPSVPQTRFYQLQLPVAVAGEPPACGSQSHEGLLVELLVRDMQVAQAYDDARISYRESEYRLDRYDYHEWAASPGALVGDALADGYAASGLFAWVGREEDAFEVAEVRGRVIALEEVDVSRTQWIGHLRLVLELRDPGTNARLWFQEYDLRRPLLERSPSGLAAATSAMLREVVDSSATAIAAALHGPCSP